MTNFAPRMFFCDHVIGAEMQTESVSFAGTETPGVVLAVGLASRAVASLGRW